jgi:hypothetical protein
MVSTVPCANDSFKMKDINNTRHPCTIRFARGNVLAALEKE